MTTRLKPGEREIVVSNLDKVMWPEAGITKYELIYYYATISSYIMPHLKNRPLVLQRFPGGVNEQGFYQKNIPPNSPEYVKDIAIIHEDEKEVSYIVADNIETLIWLGNQAAVELHPWLSSVDSLDCPDYVVFDLDPMEKSSFEDVTEVALVLKDILDQLQLSSYPKTSGATGIQVYVPLQPVYPYREVRGFAEAVCKVINSRLSRMTTMERSVNRRDGKIYLDYLQNVRGKTLIAAYSPRPLPGAPVSMPLKWDELKAGHLKPTDYNIYNALVRVREFDDLFAGVLSEKQSLPKTGRGGSPLT